MATATFGPRRIASDDLKLEYGRTEVFALKYASGKNIDGRFGPRVMFTTTEDQKLWLDAEDGSDLERGMRELGIGAGEFIRVTKIRHSHGGGHSIRVEADSPAEEATAPHTTYIAAAPPQRAEHPGNGRPPQVSTPEPGPMTPAAVAMAAAMCAAVDAIIETQAYATRRNLGVTFSEESVRAIGLSIYIGQQKGGR